MKLFVPATLIALATSVAAECSQIAGNYYCSETSKVIYQNIGFSGSYQDVTNMDETSGKCTQETVNFSGSMTPLDEELSVHFRGPLKLKQFGVYYPATGNSKRADTEDCVEKHVHHKHKRATAVAYETQTVWIDGDGKPATSGTPTSTGAAAGTTPIAQGKAIVPTTYSVLPSDATASASGSVPSAAAAGDWQRASYYTPGSASNCTFLNYYGGQGSGIWTSTFGNSLSYANADNSGASSSPVALGDVTIASNTEFVVFSDTKCTDGSGCGYYRKNIPAYHGFGGQNKIFVFEFEMPSSSATGFNGDMPAVWLLNAKIPRTLQYGDATCSCWATGCGELDLFEILSTGSNKLITHLHDGQGVEAGNPYGGGGSQDYFARPTSGSLKAAVIFSGEEIHVQIVEEDFDEVLTSDTVAKWLAVPGSLASIGY
ncbi:hypothetical protein CAAN1_05S04038 [[Candida] anglica]|uniref:glucan endo-1,3-beta-D-glucosidase n=1 Tax=[Candida] anglica TaxID=148631 RepID=A0ABP0ED00_9ASCO